MQAAANQQTSGGSSLRQEHSVGAPSPTSAQQTAVLSAITSVGLVDDDGAAAFFGCSKRTFTTFMDEAWMPRPINLGPRLRRWSVDELRAAVANMPRQTERSQPESLLRARIERMKTGGTA